MVFGFFDDKEAKLQEERQQREKLIVEQLKALQMDHELQRQTMTQKGLIAQQQRETERKKQEAAEEAERMLKQQEANEKNNEAAATANESTAPSTSTNGQQEEQKPPGPTQKLAQHVQMARKGYEQLVNAIVRPPRASYTDSHLGPAHFTFLGKRFQREDVTLMTERGYTLQCSHWKQEEPKSHDSVLVYMHGNASARVEVFQQLSYLLSLGTSVFSFDFAGSGLSDGDYVSLGYYEREDLASVVAHLRANVGSSIKIGLWGRSMGAATALMYASREASLPIQNVSCLILDSSYCDLVQLTGEMVDKAREQGIGVPNVVVSVALAAIGWSVQNKAKFNIKDISPVAHAPFIDVPALVVCGKEDSFIKPHHSERICENYKGPKNLLMVDGDHNDLRPPILFQATTQFLSKHLLQDHAPDCFLEVPEGLDLQTAPWQHRRNPAVFQAHDSSLSRQSSSSSAPTTDACLDTTTEMGMTKERQGDIQSSLVTMLGHEDSGENRISDGNAAVTEAAATPKHQGEEIVLVEEDA